MFQILKENIVQDKIKVESVSEVSEKWITKASFKVRDMNEITFDSQTEKGKCVAGMNTQRYAKKHGFFRY